jgi:uncharacterized protein YbjT (DUF2867 family)
MPSSSQRAFRNASVLVVLLFLPLGAFSFSPPWSTAVTSKATSIKVLSTDLDAVIETKSVVSTVAVAGATGRTGRLVVQKLLDRGVPKVVAIVRDTARAKELLPYPPPENLEIVTCDLSQPSQITQVLKGVDAVIWCATGFSDAKADPFEKFKRLLGMAIAPKQSIDAIGLPAMVEALANQNTFESKGDASPLLPKIVMCSSAGVTRSTWDKEKREQFIGAADIPIVRLNPFGILDVKRESEERLRQTCTTNSIPYCIVRPCGLNDKWPAGSRPVFSQGDVAVGRMNRQDISSVLVDVLTTPEATDKTFEVVALAGYPPATSIRTALSKLLRDDEGLPSVEALEATYSTMQQLLPGEQQDSAALAMGQTYEELDQGKTGRLGERGQENLEAAPLTPSN